MLESFSRNQYSLNQNFIKLITDLILYSTFQYIPFIKTLFTNIPVIEHKNTIIETKLDRIKQKSSYFLNIFYKLLVKMNNRKDCNKLPYLIEMALSPKIF